MRTFVSLVLFLSVLQHTAYPQSSPTPEEIRAKAQQALEADRADEAIALLQPLLALKPPVRGVQHDLAMIYYRTGKLSAAQKTFADAIREDNADSESVQMEGFTLYRLGQYAEAIPYLEKVRQWMPRANADASYVLGLCYLNARRYDDARAAFAVQFGLEPESGSAYLILATMLRHINLPEQAGMQARKALQQSPNLPLAHFQLGEIALLQADVNLAMDEFEAERRLNPGYAPLYDRLGDAYLRLGKLDDAQQSLSKAISLDPSITGAYTKMGKVLMRRHEPRTAILYLKHAEKMDPDDYSIHALLAQAFHLTGQEDQAKRENAQAMTVQAQKQLILEPAK